MRQLITSGLEAMGLAAAVPPEAPERLERYGQLLLRQNEVMNLTAITDPADVATLHMLDCAALLNCADFTRRQLIDVGTGGGFPGLVLKILVPSLTVTLLDSQQKRLDWLDSAAAELGLTGVTTLHARGEEAGHDPALRERFDFATARAVADLRLLAELCLPYVRLGGQFLAMKSVGADDEIRQAHTAIQRSGGLPPLCRDYAIPHTDVRHRVVLIEKGGSTPRTLPRRWAKMQKSPL